jgi:zinc transport system permease protein
LAAELIDSLGDPLAHAFMRRALLAGLAAGAACALIGVFVVQRGLSFLSEGLAHAAFGGIGLGLLLGASGEQSAWIALPFTVVVALAIGAVRRSSGLRPDAAIGVLFSVSFALGALLLQLRPRNSAPVDVEALLFGSLLAVSDGALLATLLAAGASLLAVALLWSRLAYASFDPELAALSGVPVALLEYAFLALTAAVVVTSVRTVGVVLVSAFVIIPAATARLATGRLSRASLLAVTLQVAATAVGLLASYYLDVASGPTIVLLLGGVFAAALALRGRSATRDAEGEQLPPPV